MLSDRPRKRAEEPPTYGKVTNLILKPRIDHDARKQLFDRSQMGVVWDQSITKLRRKNRGISSHMPPKLTPEIINAAIAGFEAEKRQIDAQIAELRQMRDGTGTAPAATPEAVPGKRKKFSAASRRKMAEAQRLRWAKIKGEAEPAATPEPPKRKRRMSKEGRARIVAATKARWARVRAEKAQQEKSAKK